jgi:hypothetical protein
MIKTKHGDSAEKAQDSEHAERNIVVGIVLGG